MKKTLRLLAAVLMLVSFLAVSVCATNDVVFVDWAGNDENSGLAVDAAKKTPAAAAEVLCEGGIMVVSGKAYTHKSGTFPKTNGAVTITSVYGGKDYKNPEPANNPNCAFKMVIGDKEAYVNGRAKVLDAAPAIRFDRTMLPVRFVSENLGATVGREGTTSTVTLTK